MSAGNSTMHTRLRAQVDETGAIVYERSPIPELTGREALVESILIGICGTDVAAQVGQHPFMSRPYYPGHEAFGRIVAVNDPADIARVGQRVTVIPTLYCGACKHCRRGDTNICEQLRFFGTGYREGGLSTFFSLPVEYLIEVPEDLPDEVAVLAEPLATPLHAMGVAGDIRDRAVVVIGAGTIGILTALLARASGAKKVIITDIAPEKTAAARERFGIESMATGTADDAAKIRELLGESADVIFDCVASESTISTGLALAWRGGRIVVIGVPKHPVSIPLPAFQENQLSLLGSFTYTADDFRRAIELLAREPEKFRPVVSDVYDMDSVGEAFARAASGNATKVLIRLSGSVFGSGGN